MSVKPEDADWYGWDDFVEWAQEHDVDVGGKSEDWRRFWNCWMNAYVSGANQDE